MSPRPAIPTRGQNVLPELRRSLVHSANERAGSAAGPVPRPFSRRSVRRSAPVLGVGAAVVLAVVLAIGSTDDHASGPGRSTSSAAAREARTDFALFRNAAATIHGDRAPKGSLFQRGRLALPPDMRITLADARRLAVPGHDVWVAPATQRGKALMCLRLRSADGGGVLGTCAPLASASSTGLWASSRTAPDDPAGDRSERVGLVPDGVDHVTFHLVGGDTTTAAVSDNAVVHTSSFDSRARSVTFTDADGDRQRVGF